MQYSPSITLDSLQRPLWQEIVETILSWGFAALGLFLVLNGPRSNRSRFDKALITMGATILGGMLTLTFYLEADIHAAVSNLNQTLCLFFAMGFGGIAVDLSQRLVDLYSLPSNHDRQAQPNEGADNANAIEMNVLAHSFATVGFPLPPPRTMTSQYSAQRHDSTSIDSQPRTDSLSPPSPTSTLAP